MRCFCAPTMGVISLKPLVRCHQQIWTDKDKYLQRVNNYSEEYVCTTIVCIVELEASKVQHLHMKAAHASCIVVYTHERKLHFHQTFWLPLQISGLLQLTILPVINKKNIFANNLFLLINVYLCYFRLGLKRTINVVEEDVERNNDNTVRKTGLQTLETGGIVRGFSGRYLYLIKFLIFFCCFNNCTVNLNYQI